VIEYKLSELRAVELLEDLCESAGNDYALVKIPIPAGGSSDGGGGSSGGSGTEGGELQSWIQVKGSGNQVADLGAK
jgi:hypothetical protein